MFYSFLINLIQLQIVREMKTASYEDLLAGSRSFKARVQRDERPRFKQLAKGQRPKVTFLTSSDSRIDPCALTNARAGDLFVIRNAGNIVPEAYGHGSELASLEYAVEALKTEHIVVCGHSDCEAMKSLLSPESCAHLPHVSTWVRQALGALVALEGAAENEKDRLNRVIAANVLLQLENLRKLDFVSEAEDSGRLQLHGWFYDIETGDVRVLTPANGESLLYAA